MNARYDQGFHWIGNRWVPGAGGQTLPMIDPSDGQPFAAIARGDARDVDAAVAAAREAFEGEWGRASALERGRVLMRVAASIQEHADELAAIESRDCGKPRGQARGDALACARYFEFYGGLADKVGGYTIPFQAGYTVFAEREPHGVTGHIVPWNYPLQIFGRTVAAALAAGNACVVKPGEDACLSLLRVAELAAGCGLPAGALNLVTGLGSEAGSALTAHPGIDHYSFTGSPETGTLVAQAAAERHVPVTLELGGKSPQIVFADADLDAALPSLVNAIVQNAGQTCSAGSRLLVERAIYEPLLARLGKAFDAVRVGPGAANLACGPLIRRSQLERVARFVEMAERDGLRVVGRGSIAPDAPAGGFYLAPVLFADVPADHPIAQQEIFGPVLAAMPFEGEDEAVRLANGTRYGLVAGVWTRDGARQMRMARRLRAGQVFINNYGAAGGVELPFGGVKSSGHGREKGIEGLLSFTTIKTVAVRHG
ncbi:aldehyde dehydrogenase family protein [Azohydromonas sediminis]|uniref:aldehyde dehydrogenase family protein n=1 Tax=Azohydromonas sediminis TaxID=2259674 RepID=UPI000E6561B0|nr:aldehyde dehydrogenase family protein [Azohydromonas sediminis]